MLEEIGSPAPAPGRGRWLALALLGVTVAGVIAWRVVDAHSPARSSQSTPTPSASAGTVIATGCENRVTTPAMSRHRGDWPSFAAPTSGSPVGLDVLAVGHSPLLSIDLATGVVDRPVECAGAVDSLVPVGVSWARVMDVVDHGVPRVWWVDPGQRLRQLGGTAGVAYAVAGTDSTLLVVSQGELVRYREGMIQVSSRPWPGRYRVLGEDADGLVALDRSAQPNRLLVLDPADATPRRDLGPVPGGSPVLVGRALLWIQWRSDRRGMVLRRVETNGRVLSPLPVPGTATGIDPRRIGLSVSADPAKVALVYPSRVGPVRAYVVDGTHVTPITGTPTTAAGLGAAWTPDTRWLVLSASNGTFATLAVLDTRVDRLQTMPWAIAQEAPLDDLDVATDALARWRTDPSDR
ncbi:MAG TPA: hypothetical protein VMI11_11540 [Actinomycetes bacterium]|nr:hypothetical protein [Actinomycetes bacterium]